MPTPMPRASITAIAALTPLGATAAQTWDSLHAARSIRTHSRVPDISGHARCAQIAVLAAQEAVASAGWSRKILSDDRTALIVGTSKGPIEDWLGGHVDPSGLSSIAAAVAHELGTGSAATLTLSAACATGLHALIRAAMGIAAGEFDRALVVAAEASVHPLFISSFARLGVLPPEGGLCRPFDLNRRGFLMSEAAAALCLETTPRGLAQIDRYAMAADAAHLTAGDPQAKTLKHLLTRVIDNRRLDLVHAHATGTIQHDPVELAALEATLCPADLPALYSHKAALGHSLGAAGLLSVVLNCLAHHHNAIPGNINTTDPLPTRLPINRKTESRRIQRSAAIASGFGGALAAITLQSIN
jgi:3-oxoacyl-(acyl-carrier-protein) synthase